MSKLIIDFNETTRIGHYYHYDRETGESRITVEQECAPITEFNKLQYNQDHGSFGEMAPMARIPLAIWHEWIRTGKDRDPVFVKRWLNDPDNRFFRTRPGRI